MTQVPAHLQDAEALLSETGFACGEIWYHGTSSALLDSILEQGLKGSGDQALQQAERNTLATIGHTELDQVKEPVYLTQSRELAFYWAQQAVRRRAGRFADDEQPVVIALELNGAQRLQVKPDVGAAAMLITRTDDYFNYLEELYQARGLEFPELHPTQTGRDEYLNKLGMAYTDQDIQPDCLRLVTE